MPSQFRVVNDTLVSLGAVVIAVISVGPPAEAVLIKNAGFEEGFEQLLAVDGHYTRSTTTGNCPAGTCISTGDPIQDWVVHGDTGNFNPTQLMYPDEAPEGIRAVFLAGQGPLYSEHTIDQLLTETLVENVNYELSIYVGDPLGTTFGEYSVELYAGSFIPENLLKSITQENLTPADGTFERASFSFMASPSDLRIGQPLGIRLRGWNAHFDNIVLTPEPSTALLLATGLLALTARRRRV